MNTPVYDSPSCPPSGYSDLSSAVSDVNATAPADGVDPSYFPRSHRSSISSGSTDLAEVARPAQPSRVTTSSSQAPQAPVDPLSREYPKPAAEIDVAEALTREPRKWTLAHWAKNAKDTQPATLSKEIQARKFEEAKKELLKARAEMAALSFGKK
ncbi:uncharacterized protein E0L32_007175 [Thyridium curvatum]|uniref:Uncharacterized protein n=1 Tax=Thyridium curvatum TaxID=1093900 RepID=A0A507B605_9PEZI|nr:uncharacterized protein E0L32_007175 [Thyridium curvatum]TPX12060.1 hypothetical protein E0L32_007175 [Thyridium curvatum]